MSRAGVGMVIEKLLTDERLRIRFAIDRMETIAELCLRGFELTRDEIDLFCRTDARLWFLVDHVQRRMAAVSTAVRRAVCALCGRRQGDKQCRFALIHVRPKETILVTTRSSVYAAGRSSRRPRSMPM